MCDEPFQFRENLVREALDPEPAEVDAYTIISNRLCMHHQETGGIRGNVLVRSMEEHKYRLAVIYFAVFMQNFYLVKCHCRSCSTHSGMSLC